MIRSAARFLLLFISAVLLAGFFGPAAQAQSPTLTAKFGIAGRYRPGGWCLVTVGVQNPGADTVSGQIQVLTTGDAGRSPYGRSGRQDTSSVVFACPVSVPGGSAAPHLFPLYLRGIDPAQADLTVQLVEGRARGDGRVLASINNQNQNTAMNFTGGPVGTNDTLLVGFGGDPSAFTFLSSRRLASSSALALPSFPLSGSPPPRFFQSGRYGANAGTPATLQVAEAAAASDLPDKSAGYGGVGTFLLRSDAPVEAMTEAQNAALRGWVASGGHLIVCGGPDPTRFGAALFEGLLPATVGSSLSGGSLALTPKPLPGVRVLQPGPGGSTQIVSGPYGAGIVTLTAFDPTGTAFQSAGLGLPLVWQNLLFSQPSSNVSVLNTVAAREENYGAIYYGSAPPLLSEAVMRGPSLDAPAASVIAVFLLIYLVVLVPVNYFVLKRMDRKELAWLTIPALVFLFAAGTFAVGYAAKGGSVFVNRAALIETRAGQSQAGVYSELGLFSPHRTTYDIGLPGDNLLAAVPNPGINYGRGSGDNAQFSGAAQFVEAPSGVSLPSTPVNMWAMRAFDAQSTTDLGGAVDSRLSAAGGSAAGTVTNHTAYTLTGCTVEYAGRSLKIGTLAPGAAASFTSSDFDTVRPDVSLEASSGETQANIRDRMHAALKGYFQSLSQSNANYNNMYSSPPPLSLAPNEALLTGWSSDPKLAGPAPRIDGHPVSENDVTLVVVHLPVSGAPQPVSAVLPPAPGITGTFIAPGSFGIVGRATLSYQQARDIRTFSAAQAAALVGHVVRLRGKISSSSQNSMFRSTTLSFAPNTAASGVTVSLPFLGGRNPAAAGFLVGREVVLTGTLTGSNHAVQLVVSHPSWVQVVP